MILLCEFIYVAKSTMQHGLLTIHSINGLAQKFDSGELTAEMLISASDEELIEKLVAVRGLGRWSVEMFACFGLKRMDVFSTGDLGIQ